MHAGDGRGAQVQGHAVRLLMIQGGFDALREFIVEKPGFGIRGASHAHGRRSAGSDAMIAGRTAASRHSGNYPPRFDSSPRCLSTPCRRGYDSNSISQGTPTTAARLGKKRAYDAAEIEDSSPHERSEGSTGYVWLLASVAALGGLLFGYDTAVIAGAIDFLQVRFGLDEVSRRAGPSPTSWSAA